MAQTQHFRKILAIATLAIAVFISVSTIFLSSLLQKENNIFQYWSEGQSSKRQDNDEKLEDMCGGGSSLHKLAKKVVSMREWHPSLLSSRAGFLKYGPFTPHDITTRKNSTEAEQEELEIEANDVEKSLANILSNLSKFPHSTVDCLFPLPPTNKALGYPRNVCIYTNLYFLPHSNKMFFLSGESPTSALGKLEQQALANEALYDHGHTVHYVSFVNGSYSALLPSLLQSIKSHPKQQNQQQQNQQQQNQQQQNQQQQNQQQQNQQQQNQQEDQKQQKAHIMRTWKMPSRRITAAFPIHGNAFHDLFEYFPSVYLSLQFVQHAKSMDQSDLSSNLSAITSESSPETWHLRNESIIYEFVDPSKVHFFILPNQYYTKDGMSRAMRTGNGVLFRSMSDSPDGISTLTNLADQDLVRFERFFFSWSQSLHANQNYDWNRYRLRRGGIPISWSQFGATILRAYEHVLATVDEPSRFDVNLINGKNTSLLEQEMLNKNSSSESTPLADVIILDRKTPTRRLVNVGDIIEALRDPARGDLKVLGPVYFEQVTEFVERVRLVRSARSVLTVTGANVANTLFMPIGATVLAVAPQRCDFVVNTFRSPLDLAGIEFDITTSIARKDGGMPEGYSCGNYLVVDQPIELDQVTHFLRQMLYRQKFYRSARLCESLHLFFGKAPRLTT